MASDVREWVTSEDCDHILRRSSASLKRENSVANPPICGSRSSSIDEGTVCRSQSPTPGPLRSEGYRPSPANPSFDPYYSTPIFDRSGKVVGWYRSSGGYSEVRNTNGQVVWSDELPLEHVRIPLLDTALDAVVAGLKAVGYAAVGTLDTLLENNWSALGLKLDEAHRQPFAQKLGIPLDSTAYSIGRSAGHLVSLLQSAAEIVGGATLFTSGVGSFVAGVATTPEGIGVVVMPVAVVVVATGATVVIHGGVLASATFTNAMSSGGGGGGGSPKQPSIRPPASVPKTPEKIAKFKADTPREAFNKARADAIANARLNADKVPFRSEAGPAHEIGRVKGSMNKDGVSGGWRLDFDPKDATKGLHINWWRMEGGVYHRGANVIEGGTQDLYWEILSHFPW